MKEAEDYLSAALPEPVRILGQVLQAFSLGHYKRLLRLENWYALEGEQRLTETPELPDLMMGVWVCSHTWEELQAKWLHPEKVQKEISTWSKKLQREPEEFFQEAFSSFGEYVREGSSWPDLGPPKHQGRVPGSPFIQRVQITLQAEIGLSQSEALNHPWGEALRDYFCYWEMQDGIRVMGLDEQATVDLNQRVQTILKERGCTPEEAIDAALKENAQTSQTTTS